MRCMICKNAETHQGKATLTLERDGVTLVVKGVPAQVCSNCGEEYIDEKTTRQLLKTAEEAIKVGVRVDIRDYVAA